MKIDAKISKIRGKRAFENAIEVLLTCLGFLFSFFRSSGSHTLNPQCYQNLKNIYLRNNEISNGLEDELRIVSWNILRNYESEKIHVSLTDILKKYQPHVLLIQEAPVRDNSRFWDQDIFDDYDMLYAPLHTVRQQTPFYDFLHTGQLSLSKSSFSKTEVHTLPHVGRHLLGKNHTISRVALYTQISNQNDTTIGIYNVHLENVIWHTGRRKQIEYLLGLIEKKDDEVVIIGGDFNTFLGSQESCIKLLEDAGFERLIDRGRGTPTLDHLFVRGSHQSQGSKISGNGSDHTPIYGSILLENI